MTYVTVGSGCAVMVLMALFVLVFPSSFLAVRIIFAIIMILLLLSIGLGWRNQKGTFKLYSELSFYATEIVSV